VQHAAEWLAALDGVGWPADLVAWITQLIIDFLVVPLGMVMAEVFSRRPGLPDHGETAAIYMTVWAQQIEMTEWGDCGPACRVPSQNLDFRSRAIRRANDDSLSVGAKKRHIEIVGGSKVQRIRSTAPLAVFTTTIAAVASRRIRSGFNSRNPNRLSVSGVKAEMRILATTALRAGHLHQIE